jgi:sporulation protein YlmC with PRC-barrel domain
MTKGVLLGATALALVAISGSANAQTAATPAPVASDAPGAFSDADVIPLRDWRYDDLYAGGWRARALLQTDVLGPTGDDIGKVENIIVGADGRVLSIIAQIGGVLDVGDTHVNVPWEEVTIGPALESVTIPVTEDTIERYSDFEDGYLRGQLSAATAEETITPVKEDNAFNDLDTGPRAWRVDELIGDYASLRDVPGFGYVRDVIFDRDGTVSAVVVSPAPRFGSGWYALPYYGYSHGCPGADTLPAALHGGGDRSPGALRLWPPHGGLAPVQRFSRRLTPLARAGKPLWSWHVTCRERVDDRSARSLGGGGLAVTRSPL